ncbi:MAG: DUF4307 domain-containing protein [Nocardioides sp.]|uniref:DUF4307 domain-containing protein n=1 Tax=Nocardioides kribbensis TaxID=305517 RepID=A0ABV1NYP5_9ACTN|nr:DUF4307 domain-containing protein [Nocardioides kribbensis]MBJ7529393.1 DUF4307 domain-containing protein [Nocardioides sp.]
MSSTDLMAQRYGAPAPWRRRALLALVAVVVLVFGGWLTWTTVAHADPPVTSELVTFDTVDQHTVDATVQVDLRDADVEADCLLRAFAEDHSTVGELAFTPESSGRLDLTIRTERMATSVEKIGCTAEGQPRPR